MRSSGFNMSFIWEFHIVFFEVDMPFLADTSDDLMFIDPAEYLSIFSLKGEVKFLPIEKFLYFISFFEFESSLIFRFFSFLFYLLHTFGCDLSCKSPWYEHITSLGTRYFYDISSVSDMGDISEELYGEEVCRHRFNI